MYICLSNCTIMSSNTLKGKQFQEFIDNLLKNNPGFRKNLIKENASYDEFYDIDCKEKDNASGSMRKELTAKFLQDHNPMPGGDFRSSIRGDIFYKSYMHNSKMIIDVKNYASSQGMMKLPELDKNDYIKGIDSNLKYPLFYELGLFDFIDDCKTDFENLRDFYFSDKNIEKFKITFKSKYDENKTVAYMNPSNFNEFFCFMENGFAWRYSGAMAAKGFFSKVEDTIEFKIIDFQKSIKSSMVEVKMKINDKGYVYISFYDGNDCIYIISQRGWNEDFKSNCSFINKNCMELISKVKIDVV